MHTKLLIALLTALLALSAFNIYQSMHAQARVCMAIAALHDAVVTRLDDSVFSEATAGIYNDCVAGSLFSITVFEGVD